jgi:Na+-transporting methylmalonyl-CoA/oxaloacetate decarboxylase gamma subunit
MGTLVVLLLLAVAGWVVWKMVKKPDVNNDGKVDAADVVAAVKEVAVEAKEEAVAVVAKVEEKAEVVVEKVKKARKPRAKKAE